MATLYPPLYPPLYRLLLLAVATRRGDNRGVLIERENELAILDELIESAVGGRGGAVLIEGEAGIGMTRLLACACAGRSRTHTRALGDR